MSDRDEVLVVLNMPARLEEAATDWLLGRDGATGFTSAIVFGHSSKHDGLSAAEQVSGRRRRLRFEVRMPRVDAGEFLADARRQLNATDIHCVLFPVLASGPLAELGKDDALP